MSHIRYRDISLRLIVLFSILLLALAIYRTDTDAMPKGDGTRADGGLNVNSMKLYREEGVLYRGAFGDLIPDREGDEMATCSGNGKVRVFWGSGQSWENELVHTSYFGGDSDETAQVFSIAAGSVLEGREGDEIVICDEDYSVYLIWYETGSWFKERIWRDDDWLYEVAIGDVHEDPGNEIVIVGQNGRVAVVWGDVGSWESEVIHTAPLPLDACSIGDITDEFDGNEIVIGGKQGVVTMLHRDGDGWTGTDIAILDKQVSDIVIADLDPRYGGEEIIVSTHMGSVYLIHGGGDGPWVKEIIHNEGASVYGLEAGKYVDGKTTLAVATWNNRLGLIWFNGSYRFEELYREEWIMLGTGIHDLDPIRAGPEVFGFSQLGRVTMVFQDEPGAILIPPFSSTSIRPKDEVSIPILVQATGGFQGETELATSSGSLTRSSITGTNFTTLIFSTEGMVSGDSGLIEITASNEKGVASTRIAYRIDEECPIVDMSPQGLDLLIGADRQMTFDLTVNSSISLSDPIKISQYLLPMGMKLSFNNTICDPCGVPVGIKGTLSVLSWADPGVHHFFLTGISGADTVRALPVTVTVQEATLADIELVLGDEVLFLREGGEARVDVRAISLNGYRSNISLSLTYPSGALDVYLEDAEVFPTGNTTLSLTGVTQGGPYIIRVIATGPSVIKEALLKVFVNPPPPEVIITLPDMPLTPRPDGKGNDRISLVMGLEPGASSVEDVRLTLKDAKDNISISTDPSSLDRLPYRINMTILITAPEGQMPERIVLYLEFSGGGPERIEVLTEGRTHNVGDEEVSNVWIGLLIVSSLLIASLVLLIIFKRTNIFNKDENISPHGEDRSDPAALPPPERGHGRPGGIDRGGPRLRGTR